MLSALVLQVPLVLFGAPTLPTCQLEVLPPTVLEERVIHDFHQNVHQYVRLHRRLERALPPERLFQDPEDMWAASDSLHDALVQARPQVQAGWLFTPAVADLLSRRLERAVADSGLTPVQIYLAMHLGRDVGRPEPQINGRFPLARHLRVLPLLLKALPELPEELEYQFIDGDLVIIDVHADLVVDILKDALPAPYGGLA